MIVNVIWSMFLFRGAGVNTDTFPYGRAAFMSHAVGELLSGLSEDANQAVEHVGLLIHIGVTPVNDGGVDNTRLRVGCQASALDCDLAGCGYSVAAQFPSRRSASSEADPGSAV